MSPGGSVVITLESISPVSWGGHDARTDPLIVRVPSVRGEVRRWYRWYLASLRSDREPGCPEPDSRRIWREEYQIFGGVHGERPMKSAVELKLVGLQELERLPLSRRDPFLWPLGKRSRPFYRIVLRLMVRERPFIKGSSPILEFTKALGLSVVLGGFGYRSNRGYGSFRLLSFQPRGELPEQALDLLEEVRRASSSESPDEWIRGVSRLLNSLGVKQCPGGPVPLRIQNLSNIFLLTLDRIEDREWKEALRAAERSLSIIERKLRAKQRNSDNEVDYRVILGLPIVDKTDRRPYTWKRVRRTSPLVLGVGGAGGFVRGVLFVSRDYPYPEGWTGDWDESSNVLAHLRGGGGVRAAFDKLLRVICNSRSFRIVRPGGGNPCEV